jgi:hypothetical protein
MWMPLQEISGGGDGDDKARAQVTPGRTADEFGDGIGCGTGELDQEVAPTAKQRPQQARDLSRGAHAAGQEHRGSG